MMTTRETLRINLATADDIIADLTEGRIAREAVYSFPNWEALHATLTPARVALLSALKGKGIVPTHEVVRLVCRDDPPVHADIAILLKAGLLDRTPAGVVFPFEDWHIHITGIRVGCTGMEGKAMSETVTIPREEYDALRARIEDLEDILAAYSAMTGPSLPEAHAMRIVEGEHPVRVWRDYKGLAIAGLSGKSGVSEQRLGEIESGQKLVTIDEYQAIAAALDLPLDAIVP